MSAVGRPRRKDRGEPSQQQLMAAAIDCFAHHGYQGTSIDRIARAAGVTKGALYYHFRDKEDLLFEAVKNRIGDFEHHVLQEVSSDEDALTSLRRVLDACLLTATESNHRRFIITLMVEALDTNPGLSGVFRLVLRRMRAFLVELIERGQAAGTMRSTADAEEVARLIVATIVGAEIQHYQDPDEVDLRAVLDAHFRQLAEWLTTDDHEPARRGERVW